MHPPVSFPSRASAAESWESRKTANPPLTAALGAAQVIDIAQHRVKQSLDSP
jgi:hypothetical protein